MNILILGIGNILFADEGMGAHMTHYIDEKYNFESSEHKVEIMDGGTLAQGLIPYIVKYDYVILIDCIEADGGEPGDVYFFDFDNIPKGIKWDGSAHEVEMLQTLQMMEMHGDRPETKILGLIPKRLYTEETTFELSTEILGSVDLMENIITKHLTKMGINVLVKKENVLMPEIANISFKRDMINGTTL